MFKEKCTNCDEHLFPQIFHLLTYLKNSITEEYCRLSSLMTCFLARVALILLKPGQSFVNFYQNRLTKGP